MIGADLKGGRVPVTGASSGLATATPFAKDGATVALDHPPGDARGPEVAALRGGGSGALDRGPPDGSRASSPDPVSAPVPGG